VTLTIRRLASFVIALTAAVPAVWADSGSAQLISALTDYNVTAWSDKDGLPRGAIRALAQDPDGYLWIGTEYGLVRFDGARFLTWEALGHEPLPAAAVQTLRFTADGSLWIGFDDPVGMVRIKGAAIQTFTSADGLPKGGVQTIVADAAGALWAGHVSGLYRFSNDRWEREPSIPAGRVRKVHTGASGSVFAVLDQSVMARRPGATRFERVDTPERYVSGIHEDAGGRVWMADTFVGVMTDYSAGVKRVVVQGASGVGTSLLPDVTGGLWIATAGQGLWYARTPGPGKPLVVQTVTTLTGLSNDSVSVVLEDRDGNIWAGTADGLNRLRRHPFTTVDDLSAVMRSGPRRRMRSSGLGPEPMARGSRRRCWHRPGPCTPMVAGTSGLLPTTACGVTHTRRQASARPASRRP
jgi:ligand-binding sensor domain-containing protein